MNMQDQQQLPLKDIHLPDAVSWWPPAPGYWLIFFLIIMIIVSVFLVRRYRQHYRVKRLVLKQFNNIKSEFENQLDNKKLVNELSSLLRRAAISTYPRSECASLTGEKWLSWLDSKLKKSSVTFSSGPGYLLTEFTYSSSDHADDIHQLMSLCHQWFKQLPAVNPEKEPVS